MALIYYNIDPSEGGSWGGTFTVDSTANKVKDSNGKPTEFTITSPSLTFTPASTYHQFAGYTSSDANSKYVTWRSVDISGQPAGAPNYLNVYPTTGYSFDIWSGDLYDAITSGEGATWSFLENHPNGRTYDLSTTKTTLIYDYANRTAIKWGRGGTITFS